MDNKSNPTSIGHPIKSHNWHREILRRQTSALRGTDQSTPAPTTIRQLDSRQQVGGTTGNSVAPQTVTRRHMGDVETSTHLNHQFSILPAVSDAQIVASTAAGSGVLTWWTYGAAGPGHNITLQRPDGSRLSLPFASGTHNFGSTGVPVYLCGAFDFWNSVWSWKFSASQFGPFDLASAMADGMIPMIWTPSSANTGLTTGTAGGYLKQNTGPMFP